MRISLDCIVCFQRQALKALKDIPDVKVKERVLKSVIAMLMAEDWTKTPPELAGKVYSKIREMVNIEDPFKELKDKSNRMVLTMYEALKQQCLEAPDPIEHAIRLSIAGNIMDIGALDSFDIHSTINKVMPAEFTISDLETLKARLESAHSILYFADNSGEIVLDKLLLEIITTQYPNLNKITFVVKAGPIVNDATMIDVDQVSLRTVPYISFQTLGNELFPDSPSRDSETVKGWIYAHDIVIAKGQGNYEGFSDYRHLKKIFFLLMVKCRVVASDLNINEGSIVITL